MNNEIELALDRLEKENATCVILTRSGEFLVSDRRGVAPILSWLEESPEKLRGAAVADKVIGKAAALLMVYAGVGAVYGGIVSSPALRCFSAHEIPCESGEIVPRIINRTKTGLCPMEQLCLDINDPAQAVAVLREATRPKN